MTEDERKILKFCIGEWKHLSPLEREIPRSTLYRIAKGLCGKRWLVHRRAKGYRTTKRGEEKLLQEDKGEVTRAKEGRLTEKTSLIEKERELRPSVNLAAVQKLLHLSNETINRFSKLYPPLKKVPTPTHKAIIELLWAEICDRTWPVINDHHLSFLLFGDLFTWKSNTGKFVAHMVAGEEITPYIIDMEKERGNSLYVRKGPSGGITFKREAIEKPFICLDDYHKANNEAKRAADHLLRGEIKIPLENEILSILCTSLVTLNPETGDSIFEKTKFKTWDIRRFIPCNLDAVKLPDLKRTGQEALNAAREFGPLEMKKPISNCTQCRKELIGYEEKLFTEEGQRYIDIEGLLNIARGFTGYGFSPSEAVRYVLYKVSLLYHTVGWLKSEWIRGFREEKSAPKIKKVQTIALQTQGTEEKVKKVLDEVRIVTEFKPRHEELMSSVEEGINGLESLQEEFSQFLMQEEKREISIIISAFKVLRENFTKIEKGDWTSLEAFKISCSQVFKHYSSSLKEIAGKALERYIIHNLKEMRDYPLTEEMWNTLKRLDHIIADMDFLTEEQKSRLWENFPEEYKVRKEACKKLNIISIRERIRRNKMNRSSELNKEKGRLIEEQRQAEIAEAAQKVEEAVQKTVDETLEKIRKIKRTRKLI